MVLVWLSGAFLGCAAGILLAYVLDSEEDAKK
jgi:predicted outer membrane lipoprotein